MNERIYRTPRTYGSQTGYDVELTHMANRTGRLAEALLLQMVRADAYRDHEPSAIAERASAIADEAVKEWERRGWHLPVEDAPGMDRDYGIKKRGPAQPD